MIQRREGERASGVDQGAIDRLVDGELDDHARQNLIRSLDAVPDGWKRCAVAFLEAQSWRRAVEGFASESPHGNGDRLLPLAAAPPVSAAARASRRIAARAFGRAIGLAALIAVAFGAGLISAGALGRAGPVPGHPHGAGGVQIARDSPGPVRPSPEQPPTDGRSTVLIDGATTAPMSRPVKVPLVAATGSEDVRRLLHQPPALPEYLRRQFERKGYRIESDRRMISMELADGRQVAVPVETLKYQFVGQRVH